MEYSSIIICAYFTDLILGDPEWFPHPVRIIGNIIVFLETFLQKVIKNKIMAGIVFTLVIACITWLVVYLVVTKMYELSKWLGFSVSVFFVYTAVSVKDLKDKLKRVSDSLKIGNIKEARKNLAMVVGRDTGNLDEKGIIRAAVETVSESTVDGIIAPLFYAFIGGAPLAMLYKAVNTMDSMVGYRNDRYRDFGRAAAKLDDILNFIPARLAVLLMPLACVFAGKSWQKSLKIAVRDGRKHPSPNSGIPEAVVAGALGVQLGGLSYYNSVPSVKPVIGDDIRNLELSDIKDSIKIAYITSFIILLIGVTLFLLKGVF